MKPTSESTLRILEDLINAESVQAICEDLAEVCRLKAEHVSENWQDNELAKLWSRFAPYFEAIAQRAKASGHPSFKRAQQPQHTP